MTFTQPTQSLDDIARQSLAHLETVVRYDSSSDENSDTIPSTPGQRRLAGFLAEFFADMGATIERDEHANVIASLPGRGAGQGAPPIAMLVHVDTARGTHAVSSLHIVERWDGHSIPYPANDSLQVNTANYPSLARFVGHDIVHGPGDAPFGLDDKLGLSHMMTLAWLLKTNPDIDHPPLLLIGRPDEEIGRMEALFGLADTLAQRGVTSGYTLDGIEPFEINVENFNAAQGSVWFPQADVALPDGGKRLKVFIGGVNTHGATAKAEGHRPATRLAAELLTTLDAQGFDAARVRALTFESDALRDCDAQMDVFVADDDAHRAFLAALDAVVSPHHARGASHSVQDSGDAPPTIAHSAADDALRFVHRFLHSDTALTLSAEDSEGYDGYSQPYRILPDGDKLRLDVRIRDFNPDTLKARQAHLAEVVKDTLQTRFHDQYVNMGPRLEARPELVRWPTAAGAAVALETPVLPIRGGTGVDPFLDKDIAIANLGTGYFAPESEKELTTLQLMGQHARWLVHLVQILAQP